MNKLNSHGTYTRHQFFGCFSVTTFENLQNSPNITYLYFVHKQSFHPSKVELISSMQFCFILFFIHLIATHHPYFFMLDKMHRCQHCLYLFSTPKHKENPLFLCDRQKLLNVLLFIILTSREVGNTVLKLLILTLQKHT